MEASYNHSDRIQTLNNKSAEPEGVKGVWGCLLSCVVSWSGVGGGGFRGAVWGWGGGNLLDFDFVVSWYRIHLTYHTNNLFPRVFLLKIIKNCVFHMVFNWFWEPISLKICKNRCVFHRFLSTPRNSNLSNKQIKIIDQRYLKEALGFCKFQCYNIY